MLFTKVHGLGNDFILVNKQEQHNLPDNLAELAIKVCDRHLGIGADGLVLIGQGTDTDLTMQIINSDGSEAEMCGNAIRCVAKYAYEQGLVHSAKMTVSTGAGIKVPELILDDKGIVLGVRVDMGKPALVREEIPLSDLLGKPNERVIDEQLVVGDKSFQITAVSMGNPHCVIFVPFLAEVPLALWGSAIETHPAFLNKTNVEFVQVLNDQEIRMAVWERGVGPTLACGTGACATVVAAVLNSLTDREVRVHLAKGYLDIKWGLDDHIYMTGPAEQVFMGEYKYDID